MYIFQGRLVSLYIYLSHNVNYVNFATAEAICSSLYSTDIDIFILDL